MWYTQLIYLFPYPLLDTWYSQLICLFPYPSWTRGTVSWSVCFLILPGHVVQSAYLSVSLSLPGHVVQPAYPSVSLSPPGHVVQSAYLSVSLSFLNTWYSKLICLIPSCLFSTLSTFSADLSTSLLPSVYGRISWLVRFRLKYVSYQYTLYLQFVISAVIFLVYILLLLWI